MRIFIGRLDFWTLTIGNYQYIPSLPAIKAYTCGNVSFNKKKFDDLRYPTKYTKGYEGFYNETRHLPITNTKHTVDMKYENE